MTTVSRNLAEDKDNNDLPVLMQVSNKIRDMYFEFTSLNNDGDKEDTEFRAKVVKRLLNRNPNTMCDAKYLCAVSTMIEEYNNNSASNNFDFRDWLNRYVMSLPDDPLEALSYDRLLHRLFSNELRPH
jgi:hypothetical protein